MKKSVIKFLSALLSLLLILPVFSVAAFAVAEEATPRNTCSHNFDVTQKTEPVATSFTETSHTVKLLDCYTCTKCGYYYTVNTGTTTAFHTFVKIYVGTRVDFAGNTLNVYTYDCKFCNYSYTTTE